MVLERFVKPDKALIHKLFSTFRGLYERKSKPRKEKAEKRAVQHTDESATRLFLRMACVVWILLLGRDLLQRVRQQPKLPFSALWVADPTEWLVMGSFCSLSAKAHFMSLILLFHIWFSQWEHSYPCYPSCPEMEPSSLAVPSSSSRIHLHDPAGIASSTLLLTPFSIKAI